MKFGIRKPSLKKRIVARTSPARFVRHSLGVKAPRGVGWLTNPKRAAYNRVYNRTSFKADNLIVLGITLVIMLIAGIFKLIGKVFGLIFSAQSNGTSASQENIVDVLLCSKCREKNNPAFKSCWNCGSDLPILKLIEDLG